MEVEVKALIDVVEKELLPSQISLAVDVHSGFGAQDRFWFPYAHTRRPFPFLAEAYALKGLLDQTYPHHFYAFEPMSRQYTIHGDPWDYIFEGNRLRLGCGFFIPFTLGMASGLGMFSLAVAVTIITLIIFTFLWYIESRFIRQGEDLEDAHAKHSHRHHELQD
jgi:nitrogen fixation-related uncharacterized protein